MPTEDELELARAVEYRRKMRARNANALAAEIALSGSAQALHDLRVKWSPLRNWDGWDPENEEETRPRKSRGV
jgi:hypothetical protein